MTISRVWEVSWDKMGLPRKHGKNPCVRGNNIYEGKKQSVRAGNPRLKNLYPFPAPQAQVRNCHGGLMKQTDTTL
jgi:hypothetical protein